jgi:predicted nucleotidyltransferase
MSNLDHIPPNKQKELNQIVEIIKSTIKRRGFLDMIILFGSYAR